MKSIIFLLGALMLNNALVFSQQSSSMIKQKITNGWIFYKAGSLEKFQATVPGSVHLDLLKNKIIEDPFFRTNERKLQWIDKEDWVYQTQIDITNEISSKQNIELYFKGLDTFADVFFNDSLILQTDNMFREYRVDIKNLLKIGSNSLRIYLHSPIKKGLELLSENGYPLPASNDQSEAGELGDKRVSPFIRKAPYHFGWDWGPRLTTSGIWRPVFLEAWDNVRIENIQVEQNKLSKEKAELTFNAEVISTSEVIAELQIKDNDSGLKKTIRTKLFKGINIIPVSIEIENPKLWYPNGLGEQFLYSYNCSINLDGNQYDEKNEKIGLRTIKLVQDADSSGKTFYFEVNGIPVFMKGANHIPNDNFLSRATEEVYEKEIKSAADANMNMLRVWGGGIYEEDIFYELCDKYGILIWQDFMFACSMYPGNEKFLKNIEMEFIQNIKRIRNHPSIALWCGNNEIDIAWANYSEFRGWGWKQMYSSDQRAEIWKAYEDIFYKIIPNIISQYDPARQYWSSSPQTGDPLKHAGYDDKTGDMHYWGVWHGKDRFEMFEKNIGRFLSEYGFQAFPEFNSVKKFTIESDWNTESEVMLAHQRSGAGNARIREYMSWYYKVPEKFEDFLYVGQVLQADAIRQGIEIHRRNRPYCMGTLYWQINDCWPAASWSSIDYYGNWKALHYFVKKSFENILISVDQKEDQLTVYGVSDLIENKNIFMKLSVTDFYGNEIWSNIGEKVLYANTSTVLNKITLSDIIKNKNENEVMLIAEIFEGDKKITSQYHYFVDPKDMILPATQISTEIKETSDGYEISFTSPQLVKNLFVSLNNENVFFSDNYFDVLPNTKTTITLFTKNKIDNLSNNLKIMTMNDIINK